MIWLLFFCRAVALLYKERLRLVALCVHFSTIDRFHIEDIDWKLEIIQKVLKRFICLEEATTYKQGIASSSAEKHG